MYPDKTICDFANNDFRCDDVGVIEKYINPTRYEFGFIADGTKWFFLGNPKCPRYRMEAYCYAGIEDVSAHDKKVIQDISGQAIPANSEFITFSVKDLRVIRFLILGIYEVAQSKNRKQVEKILNASRDWTQEQAKDWLRQNKIYGPGYDRVERKKYIDGNRELFFRLDYLPAPY